MTAEPIFYPNLDALKKVLRTSGIPTTSDAHSILEMAVNSAHLKLYDKLGSTTMAALIAVSDVVPPTSEDERKRLRVKLAEADLVLAELICRLPYSSLDGSAGMDEWFDKEAPFRLMDSEDLESLREKLLRNVEESLALLGSEDSAHSVNCAVLGPDYCFRPDGSIAHSHNIAFNWICSGEYGHLHSHL